MDQAQIKKILLVILIIFALFVLFRNLIWLVLPLALAWGFSRARGKGVGLERWFSNFSNFNFKRYTGDAASNQFRPMEIINPNKLKATIKWAVGIIVALIIVGSSLTIVPAGHVGVFHLFGKVSDQPLYSGLHMVNPLGAVEKMTIRTQEYTMSIATEEGKRRGDDSITALTKEGLSVSLDITVLYHLLADQAPGVYKNIGLDYSEIVIRPEIRSAIREIVADYDAKDIYSAKRTEAAATLIQRLKDKIEPRGIAVEEVLLRNVKLPDQLAQSIEQKLQADQESQRYDFVLQKEKKEADRKRIEAEGQRNAQQIISQGLTPAYLNYLYLQGLKDRPGTIYVPVNPNNGVPLFRGL